MDISPKMNSAPALYHKARNWFDKTCWGLRVVGIGAALQGSAKMGYLYVRRPKRSELRLRTGQILEFDFPNQLPRVLLMFGNFIDPEFAFFTRIHRPDWIVADVGAAIGQFTLFAATLPVAFVHAFEPSGVNVAALKRNIERNGVNDRVAVQAIALSNVETESYFETSASTWVSGLRETGSELVSVRSLDAEFDRLGLQHVSVLKINVAGYEPQVLEGADGFLARGGADILLLLLGLASLPWYAKIATYGYRFFYYHPDENALYEITSFDPGSVLDHRPWPARNIIAIHEKAIASVIGKGMTLRRIRSQSPAA